MYLTFYAVGLICNKTNVTSLQATLSQHITKIYEQNNHLSKKKKK